MFCAEIVGNMFRLWDRPTSFHLLILPGLVGTPVIASGTTVMVLKAHIYTVLMDNPPVYVESVTTELTVLRR
jgi:hypothetical protein